MANINYSGGTYSIGTTFTPSTTVHKKITLNGITVTGNYTIAANTSSDQPLNQDAVYTWTGSETISNISMVYTPGSLQYIPATQIITFNFTAIGSYQNVTLTQDFTANIDVSQSGLTSATFSKIYIPSFSSVSAAAKKVGTSTVYLPYVSFTINAIQATAAGTTNVDVVMATE